MLKFGDQLSGHHTAPTWAYPIASSWLAISKKNNQIDDIQNDVAPNESMYSNRDMHVSEYSI
jgi:hypothetical protein